MNLDFITNLWPGSVRRPATLPATEPEPPSEPDPWQLVGKRSANKRKGSGKRRAKAKPVDGTDAVILALLAVCRKSGPWKTLSVTELAEAMAVSVGEASKRVKRAEAEGLVWSHRDGRQKKVALNRVSVEAWEEIVASPPARAVVLYLLALRPRRREAGEPVIHSPT